MYIIVIKLLDPCANTPVPRVDNADFTNLGGFSVEYECNPGYMMVDPSKAIVTCSDGIWPELPVCSGK